MRKALISHLIEVPGDLCLCNVKRLVTTHLEFGVGFHHRAFRLFDCHCVYPCQQSNHSDEYRDRSAVDGDGS